VDERDRPTEWLRSFVEGSRPYAWLVMDAGDLGVAAYRLARARCRIQPVPSTVPTLRELMAAGREVSEALAIELPSPLVLLDQCVQAGLLVIEPLTRRAA
jgi:hypothetical protein